MEIQPNFSKYSDGLIPAIIQDVNTGKVLMLGFMNEEAYKITLQSQKITFFSRSKARLWTKGESSKNFLELVSIVLDCDSDTFLVKAKPHGPTCHKGSISCFQDAEETFSEFLIRLENLLKENLNHPQANSYSSKLLAEPLTRSAQKVGEEGVEVALASVACSETELISEMADLWFHSMVLLSKKNLSILQVFEELKRRNNSKKAE